MQAYVAEARKKSDIDRTAEGKEKTGVFTGARATNPVNGEADSDLGGRLRFDGIWHGRDHGGAGTRPARL